MTDMFTQETVKDLLVNNKCVVMVSDDCGACCEGDAFHTWVTSKRKKILSREKYSGTDILRITRFVKSTSDNKTYRQDVSGVTLEEFISNYVRVIKYNFIGRLLFLLNNQKFIGKK